MDENYNYLDNSKECIIKATEYDGSPDTDTYTVTFDANGGTGNMSPQTFTVGEAQSLTSNTFTHAGHMVFVGWNTEANGSGTSYSNGQSIILDKDITLYAQWKRLTITADSTTLIGNGEIKLTTNVPVDPYSITCSDSRYQKYIDGSGTNWTFQMKNNVTTELTFTVTKYGETASCTVAFEQDLNALILKPSCTSLTGYGVVYLEGNKDITGITCSNMAYNDCFSGQGILWQFHMNRNVDVDLCFEATSADGDTALCWISFTAVMLAAENVTFQPFNGIPLPGDAEVIVKDHTATIEPVAAIVGSDVEVEYITVADSDIIVSEPPVVLNGVTYNVHEIIMINGEEFLVVDTDSHELTVMRLSDSVELRFDGEKLKNSKQLGVKVEKRENQKLNINGVTYDVVAVRDGFSSLDISILYYKGKPAGEYRSETGIAAFKAGFDPATLKAQRDDIFIGRVTADNTAIADLTPGKTYNVYEIGANDIHLEGAENVGGTVAQTFDIPAQFINKSNVKYAAVHLMNPYATALEEAYQKYEDIYREEWHANDNGASKEEIDRLHAEALAAFAEYEEIYAQYDAWEKEHAAGTETGNELGTVTVAADGKTLIATYTVDSFSPFIVYAFVEADEPEIKEITTTTSKPSSSGGGGVSRYTIKFDTDGGTQIANKTVTRNSKLAEPEAPTRDGYTFNGWYTDKELTEKYDFDSKVTKGFTLYAKWDKHDDEQTSVFENPFTDVGTSDWFYEDVKYAVENGLFNGTTDTTFAPDGIITRAMMVTVLYRAEGEPTTNKSIPFADVDMGAYYANAVSWAKQNGIVNGVTETEFAPNDNITREQIAAIIHRYAKYKGYDVSVGENTNILSYDDFADIAEYAIAPMQYAAGSGLMKGRTESTLAPKYFATRAEIAAILHRFIEINK